MACAIIGHMERKIEDKKILKSFNKIESLVLKKGEVAEIDKTITKDEYYETDKSALSLSFPYVGDDNFKRVAIVNLVNQQEKRTGERQYLEIILLRKEVKGLNHNPVRFSIDKNGVLVSEFISFKLNVEESEHEKIDDELEIRETRIRAGGPSKMTLQEEDKILKNILNKILTTSPEKTSIVGKKN